MQNKPVNPLLERARMPGETFTLPSGGLFYVNGELAETVENGEVYINPMVTLDEIILKSPDKLYTGEGIVEVFGRCVPQVLKPNELLSNDVDFILTALRKISFGNTTEITYTHNCEKAKEHKYKLDMSKFIKNTKNIDPTSIKREYTKTLMNGQVIMLAPPKFLPSLKMYQASLGTENVSEKELEDSVLTNVAAMMQKVDDISDQTMIHEWVSVLTPEQLLEIKDFVTETSEWGTNFETKVKCEDCGKEIDITSEMNPVSFFFL